MASTSNYIIVQDYFRQTLNVCGMILEFLLGVKVVKVSCYYISLASMNACIWVAKAHAHSSVRTGNLVPRGKCIAKLVKLLLHNLITSSRGYFCFSVYLI